MSLVLPRRLRRKRSRRRTPKPPDLTEAQILGWCDAYHAKKGEWPSQGSGRVEGVADQTWGAANVALSNGHRGLPGGTTLAKLLAEHRGVRNRKGLPPLTLEVIAELADIHFEQTGRWPTRKSGTVRGALVPGETWSRINIALVQGQRGLPGGSSLARALAAKRHVRNRKALPALTEEIILKWADTHFATHGKYPSESAGAVEGAPGEVWNNITAALREGTRSLPGGSSLFKLLKKHGRVE